MGGACHTNRCWLYVHLSPVFDTEYDRAKVPPYNGNDPPPAPGSLKAPLFPPLLNNVQTRERKGYERGTARNFLHSFPSSGAPVVQSYWAWILSQELDGSAKRKPAFLGGGAFLLSSSQRNEFAQMHLSTLCPPLCLLLSPFEIS